MRVDVRALCGLAGGLHEDRGPADALAAYLNDLEQERAALNHRARYLHTPRAIAAAEILMVETAGARDNTPNAETYARVNTLPARAVRSARIRTTPATAPSDLALILLHGNMGLYPDGTIRVACGRRSLQRPVAAFLSPRRRASECPGSRRRVDASWQPA